VNSWYHAVSSAKKYGGAPEDYIAIHEFIDSSKKIIGDIRHRSIYHHTEGVWLCQQIFGRTITVHVNEKPKRIPVRLIAELHIEQDLGWIPSPKDYIDAMAFRPWMGGAQKRTQPASDLFGTKQGEQAS
jgi:hypothetical protein